MSARLIPGLSLLVLLTAAFVLACHLTVSEAAARADGDDAGMAERLLGGSRLLAGELCFDEADLYLHRGMPHVERAAFTNRWLQRLAAQVSPPVVVHREGTAGLRDVLPWVSLAARFAPTNADFVLTRAYLLERTGNQAAAFDVLRHARIEQPQDPALPFEEARMHMRLGHWNQAASLLELSERLTGPQPASPEWVDLLAEVCFLKSLLQEQVGAIGPAAASLARAATLKPEWYESFTNRVADLRAGRPPERPVKALLDSYRLSAKTNPLCHHDDDGD